MKMRIHFIGLLAIAYFLHGCATLSIKDDIELIGYKDPGHLAWWNDSVPMVLMLPRICDGAHPEYLIPGPVPKIALRLDLENAVAIFHDDSLGCADIGVATGDSLRVVVSRNPIGMGISDSVVLLGNLERNDGAFNAYSLGKDDTSGRYSDNVCPDSGWCMSEGAVIRYRTNGRVHSLAIQEHLHPESSPWARSKKAEASLGYILSVPVDIVLSPLYAVGFLFLYWALQDYNPWR